MLISFLLLAILGVFMGNTAQPVGVQPAAIITVNTYADELNEDGDCSVREAIQAANTDTAVDGCPAGVGEDLIVLAAGVYMLTLAGANEDLNATGDLDILADLVLRGARLDGTQFDGAQLDRVLHILPGVKVTISDLTISNGQAPTPEGDQPGAPGGGVLNEGTLTLARVALRHNRAGAGRNHNGGDGGGIFNSGAFTLTLSEVRHNEAGAGGNNGGNGGNGGGIANSGHMTLTQSVILSNTAGGGGVPASIIFPEGGFGGSGGGVSNTGIGLIDQSVIRHNGSGNSQNYIGGAGGGVYNNGSIVLTHSAIHNNYTGVGSRTVGPPIIVGGSGGHGAGIFNAGMLLATNCTISQNETASGIRELGGTHTVGGSGGDGAGIYNRHMLNVSHCTISFNAVGAGARGFADAGRDGVGGGIFNANTLTATVALKSSLVTANRAVGEAATCYGTLLSHDYNLLTDLLRCTLTGPTDHNLVGLDALLLPLDNSSGATATHALAFGSPAIDAGSCTDLQGNVVTTDQRSELRPQQKTCDIGAYEAAPPKTLIYLAIIQR